MRGIRLTTAALCAAVWVGSFAQAQTLRAIPGPAELPPPGFTSGQYVDSKGCVFVRAGYGGTVTWVPRVGNNRRPLCTKNTPAAAAAALAAPDVAAPDVAGPEVVAPIVAADAQAKVAPAIKGAPLPTVALTTSVPAARVAAPPKSAIPPESFLPAKVAAPRAAVTAPVPPAVTVPAVTAAAVTPVPAGRTKARLVRAVADCPGPAAGQVRKLTDGRSVTACGMAADGIPVYLVVRPEAVAEKPAVRTAAAVAAPLAPPSADARPAPVPAACAGLARVNPLFLVDDGRLVVQCGSGSGRGQTFLVVGRTDLGGVVTARAGDAARQLTDRTTGRTVALKVAELDLSGRAVSQAGAQTGGVSGSLSTSSAAGAEVEGPRFVQVGTFGVPQNAAGAAARLKAAGLPVQVARVTQSGKAMQIVLAGPFGQQGAMQEALATVRRAGFTDAYARR